MGAPPHTSTASTDGGRLAPIDALLLAALLVLIVVAWFPGVLAGDAISVTDKLYVHPPWEAGKPPGYVWPANKLLFDQVNQVYPWADYARTRLRSGELPLWNPYSGCGTSFFANQNVGLLSPMHLPLWLAPDTASGLTWVALLKILIAAVGAHALARTLGISPVGAVATAAIFTLSAPGVVWLGHPLTTASPFLPWSLLCAERLVTGRTGRFTAVAVTLVTAGHLLSSHPETSLHIVALTAFFGCVRAWQCHRRAAVRPVVVLALSMILGLLLAAAQLAPFVDALYRSYPRAMRIESREQSTGIPMAALPLALVPRLYGSPMDLNHREDLVGGRNFAESALFAGLLPLLLLPFAWRSARARPAVRLLLLLGAAGLFIALDPLGLPNAVLSRLPLIGLGAHHRLVLMWVLAVAVGAGAALDLHRAPGSTPTRAQLPMVVAGGALLLWGTARVVTAGGWHNRLVPLLLLASVLLVAGIPLLVAGRHFRRGFASIALALILIDLWAFGHDINPTLARSLIFPSTPTTDFLRESTTGGRILGLDRALPANTAMVYGLSDVRGYEPLMTEDYQRFWSRR